MRASYCPEDTLEIITSYLDDRSLMRMASTCTELYAFVTTNDCDWRARAERNRWIETCRHPQEIHIDLTLAIPIFQQYRAAPQAEYLEARAYSIETIVGSLSVGSVLWMTRSYALSILSSKPDDLKDVPWGGIKLIVSITWAMLSSATPIFFGLGAYTIRPRTLHRDVIESVHRLPRRLLAHVTHCSSSAIHRIKRLFSLFKRTQRSKELDQFDKMV